MRYTLFFITVLFTSLALAKDAQHAKRAHSRLAHGKHSRILNGLKQLHTKRDISNDDDGLSELLQCIIDKLLPLLSEDDNTTPVDVVNSVTEEASKKRLFRDVADLPSDTIGDIIADCLAEADNGSSDGDWIVTPFPLGPGPALPPTTSEASDDKKKRHLSANEKRHKTRSHHASRSHQKE